MEGEVLDRLRIEYRRHASARRGGTAEAELGGVPIVDLAEQPLVDLIRPAGEARPSTHEGQFAMPMPEGKFMRAPEAASEVADLRGQSGPPVERFSQSSPAPQQKSFFTRLFASLIE